jgi:hypothetical protein
VLIVEDGDEVLLWCVEKNVCCCGVLRKMCRSSLCDVLYLYVAMVYLYVPVVYLCGVFICCCGVLCISWHFMMYCRTRV